MDLELATFAALASELAAAGSLEKVMAASCARISAALGLEDCVLYLSTRRGHLVQRAAFGAKSPARGPVENPLELAPGQGIVGAAAQELRPVRVADVSADARYVVDDATRKAELAVPIVDQGSVLGVIDSESSTPGFYSEQHVTALLLLGGLLGPRIRAAASTQATALRTTESRLSDLVHGNVDLGSRLRDQLRDRYHLTPRELDVLGLLAVRRTNKEIARALGISPSTARHHTEHILSKTDLHSRRELPGLLSTFDGDRPRTSTRPQRSDRR